jgi:hypothetical protein
MQGQAHHQRMLNGAGFGSVRWFHGGQQQGCAGAIERVDSQRTADCLQVYTNLMAAPGLRTDIQQRIVTKALDDCVTCEGGLTLPSLNGHHAGSLWMWADG